MNAENRVNGKYDALPFIQSIKRFKSVELYIASLEAKPPVQTGNSDNAAETDTHTDTDTDTDTEQPLKAEEAAGKGKTQPSVTSVSVQ